MKRTFAATAVCLGTVLASAGGCKTYEITQSDFFSSPSFVPTSYRRAAIITREKDTNKLFLEGFQVELMRRGLEVLEREKFAKLIDEQLLIRGEMADLSDREKALRVGKMLNVDVVFYADALINSSRYVYEAPAFRSKEDAYRLQQQASESGVVEGVGSYKIHAYHDVGVTVRAIDAKTGEIVWVGYRMVAACEEVTEKSPTALTSFATVKKLCSMVLDDFFSKARVTEKG